MNLRYLRLKKTAYFLLILFFTGILFQGKNAAGKLYEGMSAPPFELVNLKGTRKTLYNLAKEKKLIAVVLLSCFIFIGCSKLNRENYDKVKVGMDYEQVIGIIGDPDKCDAALGAKNCVWGDDAKNVTIKFVGDKVVLPSMKGL
jgi:hypothetical protein